MNISIINIGVILVLGIFNKCSCQGYYGDNYYRGHGRLSRQRPQSYSRDWESLFRTEAIEQSQPFNADKVNININVKGGGGGGGGGIEPGGNGGNIITNLFIKKIKTVHTKEGTKVIIKPGDGRTLQALKLMIEGGGGGGGGGIGKGGDGGSIFTNLTIKTFKTVFRDGINITTAKDQNPLEGLGLIIKGGGGGGGGGPGPGGDGGDLITSIVIENVKDVTLNGTWTSEDRKAWKLQKMLKRQKNRQRRKDGT
ncbi:outer membrane protein IcsA autotransporter-like [Mytilus californianus]|uniref:outer membrane protein IcsA autotransporter-like n=1 Tax=Mytilus californianus TaxID=6549 RepID=UPI00224737EC|nr:outer membrane protein IcsA autotransporter-like [Mytilus californianus]